MEKKLREVLEYLEYVAGGIPEDARYQTNGIGYCIQEIIDNMRDVLNELYN